MYEPEYEPKWDMYFERLDKSIQIRIWKKMKQITGTYAELNNLKKVGKITDNDMSKIILMMERLKESNKANYYIMDMIIFNQETHEGKIDVSFWGD